MTRVELDLEKIRLMIVWQRLTSAKVLRGFLGITRYSWFLVANSTTFVVSLSQIPKNEPIKGIEESVLLNC